VYTAVSLRTIQATASRKCAFKLTSVTDAQFAEWVAAVKAGNGTSINPKAVQKTLDQAEFES
jgi:hypothetical protein